MKYLFQLLNKHDGSRTPSAVMTPQAFASVILQIIEKDDNFDPDAFYVLPLLQSPDVEPPEWEVADRPVLLVTNFLSAFGEQPPCQNNFSDNQA